MSEISVLISSEVAFALFLLFICSHSLSVHVIHQNLFVLVSIGQLQVHFMSCRITRAVLRNAGTACRAWVGGLGAPL